MPEYTCFLCKSLKVTLEEDLNKEKDGLVCLVCSALLGEEVVTFLEPKDNGKLGIRKVFLR